MTPSVSQRWFRTRSRAPEVAPLHQPVDERLFLLLLVVEEERAEHRGQRDRQEQGAEDREGVGVGHRAEQGPFRPGHREQRDERADDDRRREEQRPLDLVRGLGDPVDQRPASGPAPCAVMCR